MPTNTCYTPDPCQDFTERIVCRCLQITETVLIEALTTRDVRTVREIRRATGAGEGCTACHDLLKKYIDQYGYSSSASPSCSDK